MQKEQIKDANGKVIRQSRNLRGIRDYARGAWTDPGKAIKVIDVSPTNTNNSAGYPHSNGKLCVLFQNGASYETNFADWTVLRQWVQSRRSWFGAPLRVNGIDAGELKKNCAALRLD